MKLRKSNLLHWVLNTLSANPTKTYASNSSATADELLECVWSFCGGDAQTVKIHKHTDLLAKIAID